MASTYDPNTNDARSPLRGDADFWDGTAGLWENHEAIYASHAPAILSSGRAMSATGAAETSWLRWRVRGNLDLHDVRWRGYVTPTGAPSLRLSVGTVQASTSPGGAGYVNLDVTPVGGGVQDCLLEALAPGGDVLALETCRVALNPSARITRQASGYIGDDEVADTLHWAVPVEYVDRLQRGPLFVARDRPWCFTVAPKILTGGAMGAKSAPDWVGGNVTSADTVGHAIMPRVCDRPRRYIVDAYAAQSAAGACTVEIRIGTWRWTLPATGSWQSIEATLPPGPLPVVATVTAEVGVWCQVQGLQIWRV